MIAAMAIILALDVLVLALVAWNALAWPAPSDSGNSDALLEGACSVLVPARNEEANLPACLDSILRQGSVVGEAIICDDHSDDATAQLVRKASRRDPRVRLIQAGPLAEGWCGKPFACAALAAAARSEWLIFLDADARLAEGAARRMIAEAERRNLTLLSFWPGLALQGFWEKLLMPMLNFVVFTLFPAPLSLCRPADPSLGLAHGACILIRRSQYEALGGHGLVRGEIFEDTALARAWRAAGGAGLCLDGQSLVRVRMYDSLPGIWRGFLKNFYPAFRHALSFWIFLAFHAACFLSPFLLIPCVHGRARTLALGAAGCVLAMRLIQARRFGYPYWSALLHSIAETMLIAVGLASWRRCSSGQGVEWKGRRYRARAVAANIASGRERAS